MMLLSTAPELYGQSNMKASALHWFYRGTEHGHIRRYHLVHQMLTKLHVNVTEALPVKVLSKYRAFAWCFTEIQAKERCLLTWLKESCLLLVNMKIHNCCYIESYRRRCNDYFIVYMLRYQYVLINFCIFKTCKT